jgi:hypothetical protein
MKRVLALAAFQVLAILTWASHEERVRANAPTFRIPLRPNDPVEVLRWRGLAAHPLDEEITLGAPDVALAAAEVERFLGTRRSFVGPALVGFCPRGPSERVCALAEIGAPAAPGAARRWARAFVRVPEGKLRSVHIGFRFDWLLLPVPLPEAERGSDWELEVADRPGQPLLPLRLWLRGRPLILG